MIYDIKKNVNKFGDCVKLHTFAIRNNGKAQELIKEKDTNENKNILKNIWKFRKKFITFAVP